MELLDASLVDWSRGQFALTAMFHWIFVPLTLGLGVVMAIMESVYVATGKEQWKYTTKFWQKIFAINFAIGVATGIILEFQFGTNWSNYSWFVGDIFGAPLAIEGIVAFFLEATFITIMFFGWNYVSKRAHLAATWLVVIGATLSALWILIANAWMQLPVGMQFNMETVRNEMVDFWAIALSPIAVHKFLHTVWSSWILGAAVVAGVASWYMLKGRDAVLAKQSMKVSVIVGLVASLLTIYTGDGSAYDVAQHQPMKLAAMEGLYDGQKEAGIIALGILNPARKTYDGPEKPFLFKIELPKALSILGYHNEHAFVPGMKNIIAGYDNAHGEYVPSFEEKRETGKIAIQALANFKAAERVGDVQSMEENRTILRDNYKYFGYGYLDNPEQLVPYVPLVYWSFHIMVYAGGYFLLIFILLAIFGFKPTIEKKKWLLYLTIIMVPISYIASQAGWIVSELGRQPWAIQDVLPVQAAVSALPASSVIVTFFIFLGLFTALLIVDFSIIFKQIKKGPQKESENMSENNEETLSKSV